MSINIKVTENFNSKLKDLDFNNIPFGKVFTDHMLEVDYANGKWGEPEVKPFGPFLMHPGNVALHYGQSIFEGMKATISKSGNPLLFRPEMHVERINESAKRMCMPTIPEELFMEGLKKLLYIDRAWIPSIDGSALYIRPFMFATDITLGVKPSATYKFMILLLPVGPYYTRPVKLKAETIYVRAVAGGVGEAKTAGNYAAALFPTEIAISEGYDQIMWLDAKEFKYVQEVGTMNIFFVIGDKVITPITDGAILKGITRDTVIKILQDKGYNLEVRPVSIQEVVEANKSGNLKEVFGTGTAAVISKVAEISYGDLKLVIDNDKFEVANMLYDQMVGLRNQSIEDKFGWIHEVTEQLVEA